MQSLTNQGPDRAGRTVADGPADPKTAQILAASREVFLELGYAGASMDMVAQRARVSKTTLYTRFPSKQDLYAATISAECERHGLRFRPEEFDGLSLRDALRRIGRRFVDLVWSEPAIRVFQSVAGESARQPEPAQIYYRSGPEKGIGAVVALFEHLAAGGLLDTDDPAFAATQFLAALQGAPYCALVLGLGPEPTQEERYAFVDKATDLFLRGVAPASQKSGS